MIMKSSTVNIALALLLACPALLRAGIGVDATKGPGIYQSNVLSFDVNLLKTVNLGVGYENTTSTTTAAAVKSYSANLGFKAGEHWSVTVNGSNSPEAGNSRSSGWGIAGAYNSGGDEFSWGISLAYGSAFSSEYVDWQTLRTRQAGRKTRYISTDHSQWMTLQQGCFGPSVSFGIRQHIDLSAGYSKYSYDRDVEDFSQQLSRLSESEIIRNANFDGVTSLIQGFPDHIVSAGIGYNPFGSVRISYDWSRTGYVVAQPMVDSSTIGLSYTFRSIISARFSYTILAYRDVYTTFGVKWLW